MTVDDDLDSLYGTRPEEFTARRKELAAAARQGGDAEAAKAIAAARRPTMAAWVVNRLALTDATVRPKLADLHGTLRAAHAAMDGQRIRELSSVQRRLVQELTRAAFASAELDPTPAVRDDVTATLQAAIADPDVAARLGRLSRAEEWSGFGDFGVSSAVVTQPRPDTRSESRTSSPPATKQTKKKSDRDTAAIDEARRNRDNAASELNAARTAHDDAVASVAEHRASVKTARRRYEKLLEAVAAAEHDIETATTQLNAAERSEQGLQRGVHAAEAALRQADSRLDRLTDR